MAKLREIREKQFLTQVELADKAQISEITLNRLENRKQKPRFVTIRKLAKALGVEPGNIQF
jgi:transcriptional regulator with XRE-family HTH domain